MQIVLVSSPGTGQAPHWSQELAGAFAREVVAEGASVRWLAALHQGEAAPPGEEGVQVLPFRDRQPSPLSKVNESQADAAVELALTESLRAAPESVVVHVGLGGQGTPNALWLASRLGSRTFACARGAELVCHRGDLLDRDKKICRDWADAERCRWCCSTSWWSKPRADDLRNRQDLFVAGLHTCAAIAVPAEADVELVTSLGVASSRVSVGASAAELAAMVTAAAR